MYILCCAILLTLSVIQRNRIFVYVSEQDNFIVEVKANKYLNLKEFVSHLPNIIPHAYPSKCDFYIVYMIVCVLQFFMLVVPKMILHIFKLIFTCTNIKDGRKFKVPRM